jgi:iron complex outermembrane receptor protein
MAAALAMPAAAQMFADANDALTQLSRMSLEELARVEVTSVSKSAQSLSSAPASIYVITHEELRRSGALSIPEALRLAPNLQVEQINSQEYQITARGFGSNLEMQNFSNKILILIDGRSVYNPLFSGVAYDAQDVVMDDVDRIEVISGPGATLWGANAMNGVINIITRNAHDSEGGLLRASAGNLESALSARYGGSFGAAGAFRLYAKGFDRGPSELPDGASAGDRWHKLQTGFRVDVGAGTDANRFTIQGDYQDATESFGAAGDVGFTQYDLSGRWEHSGEKHRHAPAGLFRSQRSGPTAERSGVHAEHLRRRLPADPESPTAPARLGPGSPLQRLRHHEHADAAIRARPSHAGADQCVRAGHDGAGR